MKQMMIAGNWKMHKLSGEARQLASDLKARFSDLDSAVKIVLCPPFTALPAVASAIAGTRMFLGAQNTHWEEKGAFTGEVAPAMLKDVGCTYVIIGHSERRQYFGETDETVNKKTLAALKAGLKPIVCVGETEGQRDKRETEAVVMRQIRRGLAGLSRDQMANITVAYEPVWAIGTGKNATPQQAQEVHVLIRSLIAEIFERSAASALCILYGGSLKPDNADELLTQPDVNGGLIGGASLVADSFEKIARSGAAALTK